MSGCGVSSGLWAFCWRREALKADKSSLNQSMNEQNHVRAVRSATGSPSTERPIVPISASNSMWAPLAAPCALHEAGQASHTW